MLKPQLRLKALPLVASMLGDELGVKVVFGEQETACTDGATVYLPPLPMEEDEQLYWLVSGYIDHEAAHIRHTDFEAMKAANLSPVAHLIFNIIEDWRVEHELVKRYPGCREHFDWLNRYLYLPKTKRKKRKAGGNVPPAFFILDYVIGSVNMGDVPELKVARTPAARVIDKNWPTLRKSLDDLLAQVPERCHSTTACIDMALEIMALLEAEAQREEPAQTCPQAKSDTESSQKNEANQPSSRQSNCSSADENEQPIRGENGSPGPDFSLSAFLDSAHDSLPKELKEQLQETISGKNPRKSSSGVSMASERKLAVQSLSPEVIQEAQRSSRALRTRLQGLLQTRVLRRVTASRYGKTSGQLLHRIATRNPRIFRKADDVPGIDTAIHILLDRSGSMSKEIGLACQACYALASALAAINGVNLAVTAFPSDCSDGVRTSVFPLLRHGERLSDKFNLGVEGMTPLTESLWWVTKELLKQKEQRKLILIISDGLPDDPQIAVKTLATIHELDIEVAGIAIDSWHLANLINAQENLTSITELAPAMFRVLHHLLIKGEKQ